MKLRFGDVFARAVALWGAESALLIPIAAIFFFLPVLAVMLFVPVTDLTGLEGEARTDAVIAVMQAQMPWTIAQAVVQTLGVGAILTLLLDPARPSIGQALSRTLVRLPGLIAARIIAFSGVVLGLLAFIVPGFYLVGRTFITSAVYIAEPQRGPAGAAVAGFQRTAGFGWLLFLVAGTVNAATYLIGNFASQGMLALGAEGGILGFPFAVMVAAALAWLVVIAVLLEVVVYRGLGAGAPRQGPR